MVAVLVIKKEDIFVCDNCNATPFIVDDERFAKFIHPTLNKGINIPTGWREAKLGSVIGIYGGYAFKSSDQLEAGVRWLKIANVGIGKIVWNEKSFLPESTSSQPRF